VSEEFTKQARVVGGLVVGKPVNRIYEGHDLLRKTYIPQRGLIFSFLPVIGFIQTCPRGVFLVGFFFEGFLFLPLVTEQVLDFPIFFIKVAQLSVPWSLLHRAQMQTEFLRVALPPLDEAFLCPECISEKSILRPQASQ
jgi:hypothetical protein